MKRQIITLSIVLAVFLIIAGCPYASKVPIDEPTVKIKKELIGKWIKSSSLNDENPKFFVITTIDKTKYNIEENEYNSSDSTYRITNYVSHISEIDDLLFMNMQKNGQGDYFLYKIDLGSNEFTLFEITDNIDEKFNTSSELKGFIKKHMNLSFFYNKDEEKYTKSK